MVESYKNIEVTCPTCGYIKSINVPEAIFTQKKFGTVKVQIPAGAICKEHQFIVFVDTKGIIRGYEKIDMLMKVPSEQKEKKPGWITLRTLIQKYGLYGLFSLIHAKVFNYPHYIIRKKGSEDISSILNKIGENVLPDNYKGKAHSIQFLEEIDYDKIKLKEKEALLIDSQLNILQTPWEEKLKFEESIVEEAIEIFDDKEQLIIIQQGISKLINEAEFVRDYLETINEIYEDDLIEHISQELKTSKMSKYRLSLIKVFISRYYDPKLISKIKNKVQEFLDLL